MMKLSLVVPTHRRPARLFRLLDSLARQSMPKDQFEILVVSNFEDAKLRQGLEKSSGDWRNVRLLVADKKGANVSRNLGIKESRGEIILLLDDDCVVQGSGYLQAVCDQHRDRPEALAIGGTYSIPNECRLADVAYNIIARDWQLSGHDQSGVSLRLLGGNVSYKKELLEATGETFNPDISYGGAELEFHNRLANKGSRLVLAPELAVHHIPEIESSGELVKKAYKQAMTSVQFSIPETAGPGNRGYHSRRNLMALRYAHNERELARICDIMLEYDLAYNMVAQDHVFSLPKLRMKLGLKRLKAALGRAG